LSGDC